MTSRKLLLAALLAVPGAQLVATHPAHAQSQTTGAIQGVVTDSKTGEKLPAVTVVVTSPALSQAQSTFTDENGFYKITELPPGEYTVTFYYAELKFEEAGVHVGVSKVSPVYQKIDQSAAVGETIHVKAHVPTIDPTSTTQGITLDENYLKNIPVPGRTFDAALGAAAGSQGDDLGVAFSGSTSLENQYYVDGVNTTGLTYGTVGSPVVNDFIEEIEVITGGYNAEYGRSTGGIVNVVTKSGSNEVKGSVWGYWQPGALTYAAKTTPVNATSIDTVANLNYNADVGFELGGPIIKDKLWYFIGFDPTFSSTDYGRTTKRETDCRVAANPGSGIPESSDHPGLSICDPTKYHDGVPDVDPKTGFFITDPLDTSHRTQTGQIYNILAKINYAATPEHQGQIAFTALPANVRVPLVGTDDASGPANTGFKESELTTDLSGKWTSKFNDNKTEIEAVVGWHRDYTQADALDPTLEQEPNQALISANGPASPSLYTWGTAYGESPKTLAGCFDSTTPGGADVYPYITNCPMQTRAYVIGGPGGLARDTEQRFAAKVSITERLRAAGSHEIKAGIDAEDNTRDKSRLVSGGESITNFVNQNIYTFRYVALGGLDSGPNMVDNPDPNYYNQECRTPNPNPTSNKDATLSFYCADTPGTPGARGTLVAGSTINWAAYLRDSWQIRPNLTLNYGIRYEAQELRYASFLQNTVDPLTQEHLGTTAMNLNNNWAPRIGLLYDPTKEGRSKIYANWGRYYEAIPMDINDRSFGGEVTYEQEWSAAAQGNQCGPMDPSIGGPNGKGCGKQPNMTTASALEQLVGSSGELVEPGIKAEYLDETLVGFEYEILDDLKIGVAYQNRNFGRIIEDVSTDGANTYIIANPGEWDSSDEKAFQQRIDRTDDPTEKARLMHELTLFEGIRIFDSPRRDYNALQFTMTRRFSKQLYVQASYTYSRTEGNYPGSYSPDNGQVDPNISSQYDLIELLANRIGPLPQDRPHYIKVDGYYTFDLKKQGALTVGIRLRALSGVPENALASHYLYGPNESFLLPRGELGRSDFDHSLDLHVGYARKLHKNIQLELFLDAFDVYNRQGTYKVDDTYAEPADLLGNLQNANPVSGGTYDDLIWVKRLNSKGGETNQPIGRNPNFHNTIERYAPGYVRLGARLTF